MAEVTVIDAVHTRRVGIARILEEHGVAVALPEQPHQWLMKDDRRLAVFSLDQRADVESLRHLTSGRNRVVALVDGHHEHWQAMHVLALDAGATAVIPADVSPLSLAGAVSLVADGVRAVWSGSLPDVRPRRAPLPDALSDVELGWLRALRRGETVAQLAVEGGLSERTMHRRLASLYRRLGVANRTDAVALAERLGLD